MSNMALSIGKAPLIRPVAALAGWTFVMEVWMYATRIPAMQKYKVDVSPDKVSSDLQTKIPPSVRFKADNYNHLHEQPTVFYAIALSLAILGDDHPYTVYGAWAYVATRIIHSVMQATVNKVMVRFQIFATSSLVLAGMTGRLAQLIY
ncbi:hypothetical protein CLAFUW4_08363 [Fulvia fulva]|uniref:Uncharacterized protein n=1 Tax=Passalora fulva TaxID=5499 RepID=A0A9Q8LD65_PASFU|nr:uncharacterized protein CLAFUR5_08468 [Fulvia fulva]KAK4629018.1 hypothetical protein CLAFUR4_08368 [Fulvia fulva]KAK4629811.1 hypothetical protein CLAFUR0_08363 [Fulvia fulva]UJO15320.1 hypothetical protein CLAFUR5_08468 [Fulvia fulva]WPV12116.1 hypothetical protein CLAFUW4_08363 [Fulvia fulva]WPV27010.1 hypothetical protein CLAFUW7_08363 [Fulvia fulva]